jgi:hypothetical protein
MNPVFHKILVIDPIAGDLKFTKRAGKIFLPFLDFDFSIQNLKYTYSI